MPRKKPRHASEPAKVPVKPPIDKPAEKDSISQYRQGEDMRPAPAKPKPPARPAPLPDPPPEPAAVQDVRREPSEASPPAQSVQVEPQAGSASDTCEHCRSFVDAGKTGGYCYRNPPALRVDGVSSAYPPVRREWWCNEFKQAPRVGTTH